MQNLDSKKKLKALMLKPFISRNARSSSRTWKTKSLVYSLLYPVLRFKFLHKILLTFSPCFICSKPKILNPESHNRLTFFFFALYWLQDDSLVADERIKALEEEVRFKCSYKYNPIFPFSSYWISCQLLLMGGKECLFYCNIQLT